MSCSILEDESCLDKYKAMACEENGLKYSQYN